jgi:acyl carrier protein
MTPEKPEESVVETVKSFIREDLAYGDEADFDDSTDLIDKGVIDSMSLLRLVSFIEEHFHIQVQDEDMVPSNFRSPRAIETFVLRCIGPSKK